jgi:predicted nucleic acid-binding protein
MSDIPLYAGIPTLVDTNVIIDVMTQDAEWHLWSENALRRAAAAGSTVINQIVYAELAPRFERETELDDLLIDAGIGRDRLPWPAAFLAGQAHQLYRKRGGERRATLPDFFIGAHAAVRRYALLTRDARLYRTYFPSVDLICPDSD